MFIKSYLGASACLIPLSLPTYAFAESTSEDETIIVVGAGEVAQFDINSFYPDLKPERSRKLNLLIEAGWRL